MKIKDLNSTIINSMIMTGTVIDCKEGYMEISQQSLSEPTLTISVPSTVTVGTPTTITVTASVVGDITVYINQEYYQTSIGESTMSFTYTPQDTFTIEAYFSSTQGISVNASQKVVLIDFTPAVQSFNPSGENYNDVFQEWLYNNGYSAHADYTTMEEALNLTEIPSGAFQNNTSLTHMDELQYFTNLTSIGLASFSDCTRLTSITIPNSVTNIDNEAFSNCVYLTSITIPNSVTSIGEDVFYGCTGLTNVTIGNSVTSINDYTFSLCVSLTDITIPSNVTSIGNSAFSDCNGLKSITIPNSVTHIGGYAFKGCLELTNVNIPNGITEIYNQVFYGCESLTNITIPNGVTTIYAWAFQGCTGLTSIIIPNSVTKLGFYAFESCTSLYHIYCFATTPPTLYDSVFENVPRSATVYVPQGSGDAYRNAGQWKEFNIEEMGTIPDSWAVQNTNPAGDKYNPALQVWARANGYSAENDYTTKTEAQAVTVIEANAFNNNTNLTSINELQYFTNISIINDHAFRGTTNLTTGILPPSVNDIYVGAFQNSGIQALNPRMPYDSTDYTKGASNVTASNISRSAFAGSDLTSVTFGSNTTTVGTSAFEGCQSLRNVYGEDSGWISVQNNTFKNCPMLKSIYLPSTVTMLLSNVVDGCTALEAIYCYATTPPSVTASTFTNMPSDVTLYVPYASLSTYQSSTWANYFRNILPIDAPQTYACQSIDANGANYNPVFQEWLYNNNIASNSGYTTMTEALNLREIPGRAFYGNTSLEHMDELQYFTNLTTIGFQAFGDCQWLSRVRIPSSVTNIGDRAFYKNGSMTVYCYATTPPSLGMTVFYYGGTLYVPSSSVDRYRNSDWNERFSKIQAIQ